MSLNTFDNTKYQMERKQARQRSLQLMEQAAETVDLPEADLNEIDFTESMADADTGSTHSNPVRQKSIKRAQAIMDKISNHSMKASVHRSSSPEETYNLAPRAGGGGVGDDYANHSNAMLAAEGGSLLSANGRQDQCCDYMVACVTTCNKRKIYTLLGIFAFVLIGAFAIGSLTKIGDRSKSSASSGGDDGPIHIERYNAIRTNILQSGFTSQESLDEKDSPQNKALRWLADFDAAYIDTDHIAILQRYALATFFFSTYVKSVFGDDKDAPISNSGPAWARSDHWMSGKGICMWYGITCPIRLFEGRETNHYNDNSDVLHFNLTDNNIRGTIPSELVALENLLKLDLGRNNLQGTVPASLGDLQDLENLYLIENDLTGTLPEELGACENMRNIHFGGNQLTGPIPQSMMDYKNLESFGVDENYLTGKLPEFEKSKYKLLILYLDENQFTGTIPRSYGDYVNVFDLRLAKNKLTGNIPQTLGFLSHLELLYLDENELEGKIPDVFSEMNRLEELQLYKNHLTGPLPASLTSMDSIRVMYLDSNQLSGEIPKSIGNLDDVETLYMYNNKFTGKIPAGIGGMKNLKDFQIYSNGFTGSIPTEIGLCFKLETLYLEDNQMEGQIPSSIGELDHLKSFRFYRNKFTGRVPNSVCNLESTHKLEFIAGDCSDEGGTIECACCHECYP
mmetsp:Transcript_9912/g.14019  ORF Transcript_9912/g.14019 Transcript_9912/m.14019 type:complete len:681 (+) Transcript_9912:158-2200(+)